MNYTIQRKGDKTSTFYKFPHYKRNHPPQTLKLSWKSLLPMYKSTYISVSPLLFTRNGKASIPIYMIDCTYRSGHIILNSQNWIKSKNVLYILSLHTLLWCLYMWILWIKISEQGEMTYLQMSIKLKKSFC